MKVTVAQIEKALRQSGGFVSLAAKKLGVTHQAVSKRIKKNKKLQKVLEEIQESYLDLAEAELIKKIKSGDLGALCFYLKCKGKSRGYIEKVVLGGDKKEPLEVIVRKASKADE